ncbi:DEAD/DEAH box helicase [Acinetobacter bereziniae]|uniref:DEAD/DEAH box helicase n=1 Tax=Acinetobacter bereziniae TaxID=106648 RepID=UPI0018DC12EF|nr:DEAD/DEAH box helicase [Acinetobacter bereziniae]MBI0395874.1 DEAD/DEAH box helicase [Acinetobacter bereziniae]
MQPYYSDLLEQACQRTKESTLSVLGINDPELREHLAEQMSQLPGSKFSFLAPPVFEHTFAWKQAPVTMTELSGKLLAKSVVSALDSQSNGRYRFGAEFKPFEHQLKSWKNLLADKKSIVVTSGTGSGKTECFMVPILNDLFELSENMNAPLEGVHALFLYPLNALINSQEERLSAWTQHFGGKLRYCLYNGNTPESESSNRTLQKDRPYQVLSRELMRKSPAPILVTNGTMLEYIMVRQIDAPIIEKSRAKKSLRWIVLDEAHSYVGSQAAELALQLRRVLEAFGVEAKDVRFVATSATIADSNAEQQLKTYLSQLAGIEESQIEVIGGQRAVPQLKLETNHNKLSLKELSEIESDLEVSAKRFEALESNQTARAIREIIVQQGRESYKPLTSLEIKEKLNADYAISVDQVEIIAWIDLLTNTKAQEKEEAFLKVRAHFLQRITHGLWSCINPHCNQKEGTALKKWPYGNVYATCEQKCKCESPVLELTFCKECNSPHLLGQLVDANDGIRQLKQVGEVKIDEFSLLTEEDEIEEADINNSSNKLIDYNQSILLSVNDNGEMLNLDRGGFEKYPGEEEFNLFATSNKCHYCELETQEGYLPVNRSILGAPFYVTKAIPTILEFCPDITIKELEENGVTNISPQSLPSFGRRLITFTDSRQGTARMSVQMQQEAQRSRLRGAVVEMLKKIPDLSGGEMSREEIEEQIEQIKHDPKMKMFLTLLQQELLKLDTSDESSISWKEMIEKLTALSDFNFSILNAMKYYSPEVFGDQTEGSHRLISMLLLSEFSRRPRNRNSTETLGLVKVGYSGLEKVSSVPLYWESKGLNLQDWKDFLKVVLDFYVREYYYIHIDRSISNWMGRKIVTKRLFGPDSKLTEDKISKQWPLASKRKNNRLVKLLALGGQLDLNAPIDIDIADEWLKCAWKVLTQDIAILESDNGQFFIRPQKFKFSLNEHVFICPVTHRLIDTTFKGITPYLPTGIPKSKEAFICQKTKMPNLKVFSSNKDHHDNIQYIRELIANDETIKELRSLNLWNDLCDRIIEGGMYYRVAEHSAQQASERLQDYEKRFKSGEVNVMNCSTTMEMGVDIGGISAVVMNNVPPHPANYLQRAGRAGRSKESRALSYTICKSNPHDQQVFHNPKWAFETSIPAPYVALNSKRLIQRHVNSMYLSFFLKNEIGNTDAEKTKLNLKWFYLANGDEDISVCNRFINWLKANIYTYSYALEKLIKGTDLSFDSVESILGNTIQKITEMRDQWLREYLRLETQMSEAVKGSAYAYRLSIEMRRLSDEYLLRELAAKCFLPGYGFPTDIASFETTNVIDYIRQKQDRDAEKQRKSREDNVSLLRDMPSRNLAVAIREYAPGSEIVLDGRVFKSKGISLAWHNIHSSDAKEAQKFDLAWRCVHCGQNGFNTDSAVDINNVYCDNPSCGEKIRINEQRKVLQPTGFVHDFYEEPSNDVTTQTFIPVQTPWIAGKGARLSLPNSALGFMVADTSGHVFNYSSGLYGHGYAVCLECGRAESQKEKEKFPLSLSPEQKHYPLKPSKHDRENGQRKFCEGSERLIKDLHLGSYMTTDIFELVLHHPERNEYLTDNKENESIAFTLAVAFRKALAKKLGISANELGYGKRPILLDGNHQITAIQVYDVISGGAGFASSAPRHIESLLSSMVDELECPKYCESVCAHCLLDSQSRHHYSLLNRHDAKKWLGANYKNFISTEELSFFSGAQYWPYSLKECIEHHVSLGAKKLILNWGGESDSWELLSPSVKKTIARWAEDTSLEIDISLPQTIIDSKAYLAELKFLQTHFNVQFDEGDNIHQSIVAQLYLTDRIVTVVSPDMNSRIPNEEWLNTNAIVGVSETYKLLSEKVITLPTLVEKNQSSIVGLDLLDQLNVDLCSFGRKFWNLVAESTSGFGEICRNETIKSIEYSDRYIKSASNMLLIVSWLKGLEDQVGNIGQLKIKTVISDDETKDLPTILHHDYHSVKQFEKVFEKLLTDNLDLSQKEIDLMTYDNGKALYHKRNLTITFESGTIFDIQLDQGLGYWRLFESHKLSQRNVYFNAQKDFISVANGLTDLQKFLVVKNGEQNPTNIYVKKREGDLVVAVSI